MNSTEYAKKEAARIALFWKGENGDQLALPVEQLESYLAIAYTEGFSQALHSSYATVNQPESEEWSKR
jgi:hypothetical protein